LSWFGQVVAEAARHGKVGRRITASDLRQGDFAGSGDHRKVVLGLERVAGGDDNARFPDKPLATKRPCNRSLDEAPAAHAAMGVEPYASAIQLLVGGPPAMPRSKAPSRDRGV
jgi:hypothetical protein